MKEQILELRAQGKSYNEIAKLLGCSKGTVSYHCGEGQKEKSRLRVKAHRKNKSAIIREKIDRFNRAKIRYFKLDTSTNTTDSNLDYNSAFELITKTKICYLSGRDIDLEDSKSYHLDHKIPRSKGGNNELDNLGIACKEANMAKSDMLVEDFVRLCVDVCRHNGYKVE